MTENDKPYSRHIYLPQKLARRLEQYAIDTYGSSRRVTSFIIQQAIEAFLRKKKY